jgi:hypothetical protein
MGLEEDGAAQARLLLETLHELLTEISKKLDTAERRGLRTSMRGTHRDRRQLSELRREFYEVHHLIDGLHRRFPVTVDSWPADAAYGTGA